MKNNEQCPSCGSLSTSTEDGLVLFCCSCKNNFSRCEKCNDIYKTHDDPNATHFCLKCQKLTYKNK